MTDATYKALENDAIAEVERLLSFGVRTEDILIVMTRNVYLKAVGQEHFERTDILHDTMMPCARFYGYDVGIINEDAETMFKAAVKGMNYYPGMMVGDTIIVNEDGRACRIYALENTIPVCFTDTGLTVKFEIELTVTSANRPTDYERITMVDTPFWQDFGRYIDQLDLVAPVAAPPSAGVDWDSVFRNMQNTPWIESSLRLKPKIRHPKEAELSTGDTKELDDFLNSFAKKSAMESAT